MRKGNTGKSLKGVMGDEEFKRYKEKITNALKEEITEYIRTHPELWEQVKKHPKRKLDL